MEQKFQLTPVTHSMIPKDPYPTPPHHLRIVCRYQPKEAIAGNNMRLKAHESSFSFIELIVSITIIIIFASLGLAYYNNLIEQTKLDQETKRFVDTLELAKTKAASGDSSLCQGNVTPYIERYVVNVNPTGYQFYPICVAGTPVAIKYDAASNINIETTPAIPLYIDFYPLLTTPIPDSCVIIKNTNLNKCNYVGVNSSGNIADNSCQACSSCVCP